MFIVPFTHCFGYPCFGHILVLFCVCLFSPVNWGFKFRSSELLRASFRFHPLELCRHIHVIHYKLNQAWGAAPYALYINLFESIQLFSNLDPSTPPKLLWAGSRGIKLFFQEILGAVGWKTKITFQKTTL